MLEHTCAVWCMVIQCSGLSLPMLTLTGPRLSRSVRQGSSSRSVACAGSRARRLSGHGSSYALGVPKSCPGSGHTAAGLSAVCLVLAPQRMVPVFRGQQKTELTSCG